VETQVGLLHDELLKLLQPQTDNTTDDDELNNQAGVEKAEEFMEKLKMIMKNTRSSNDNGLSSSTTSASSSGV